MNRMEIIGRTIFILLLLQLPPVSTEAQYTYNIVDTGQETFYNDLKQIRAPNKGNKYYGQDAHYSGNTPKYTDNGNGTITDLITGLMWQKDMGPKMTKSQARKKLDTLTLGGYTDWRIPTIKELYSLIKFNGRTGQGTLNSLPYIDTLYFIQPYGDIQNGERHIDAQTWSSTEYTGRIMGTKRGNFGVNFIDGRIKSYPLINPRTGGNKQMYFRMVRGNPEYGTNKFVNNGDGTITDQATGLMWQAIDNGKTYNWQEALEYAENFDLAGYDDWRLPNAKELQSIVDYNRSPLQSNSPAIDPLFRCSEIIDPAGQKGHYGYYWTGTTHLDGPSLGKYAVYIAFGRAQGFMRGRLMDVHGAGAQRGDPKSGKRSSYPQYFGPQGDVRYVYNFVRCVRDVGPFE